MYNYVSVIIIIVSVIYSIIVLQSSHLYRLQALVRRQACVCLSLLESLSNSSPLIGAKWEMMTQHLFPANPTL